MVFYDYYFFYFHFWFPDCASGTYGKIAEVCVVGIAKITLLAIQEVDIVTIRVLQDFWEITAI